MRLKVEHSKSWPT